jgi:hypothetical protein
MAARFSERGHLLIPNAVSSPVIRDQAAIPPGGANLKGTVRPKRIASQATDSRDVGTKKGISARFWFRMI